MVNRKTSIEVESGAYFWGISLSIAVIATSLSLYLLWVEVNKTTQPDFKRIFALLILIGIVWGLVLLVKSLFKSMSKKREVEDLFQTIREANKKARKAQQVS